MLLFFLFGLFLGSLSNTIALRLETKERFIFARSHCPHCNKVLRWYELIPILSFILQKGRCLGCKVKIPWRYPVIEIFTGIWSVILAFSLQTKLTFFSLVEYVYYLVPVSILFILALYDWRNFAIDNRFIIFGIFWFLIFYILNLKYPILPERHFSYFLNYLFDVPEKFAPFVSALGGFSFFSLLYFLTLKRGIGFGDALVFGMLGFYFKIGDLILILIFSSLWGTIYGLYLRFTKHQRILPFVPFIFFGLITVLVFGKILTSWYFGIFS